MVSEGDFRSARDVLRILSDGKPRSKAELVAETGLARATIGARLSVLQATGLVEELEEAVSTGGRPSAQYAFRSSAGLLLVADVDAEGAWVGITDFSGALLWRELRPCEVGDGPETVLEHLRAAWSEGLTALGRPAAAVRGVGLGLPGGVDAGTGCLASLAFMASWDGFDVAAALGPVYGVPVLVDNDTNVMCLGERATAFPDERDLVVVKLGEGVGIGVISGGHVVRGAQGIAGDIGHVAVSGAGERPCPCGLLGCLGTVVCGPGVLRSLHEQGREAADMAAALDLVRRGDPVALRVFREAGRMLGEVLAMCVGVLNPAQVLLGGTLAQAGAPLLAGVREAVYARSQPLATRRLTVEAARSGPAAGLVGAAWMVREHLLA